MRFHKSCMWVLISQHNLVKIYIAAHGLIMHNYARVIFLLIRFYFTSWYLVYSRAIIKLQTRDLFFFLRSVLYILFIDSVLYKLRNCVELNATPSAIWQNRSLFIFKFSLICEGFFSLACENSVQYNNEIRHICYNAINKLLKCLVWRQKKTVTPKRLLVLYNL
jgi:hypothetical protein